MVVTIHQPEHLPWLGFFDKARCADVLVLLDSAPFRKDYFQNRNRIRSDRGAMWLTVPVLTKGRLGQALSDVEIDNLGNPRWRVKSWASLSQFYRHARHWSEHEAFFAAVYEREWSRLAELNEHIIRYVLAALPITARVVKSSELDAEGHGSDLVLDICRRLGARVYLAGISGKEYLKLDGFAQAGIDVRFQEFHHPIYKQLHEPFLPCMSVVDLLFNYGHASLDAIAGLGVETMAQVYT